MPIKWKVYPVELETAMEEGTTGEPFAYDFENDMVYVKEQIDTADYGPKSSDRVSLD